MKKEENTKNEEKTIEDDEDIQEKKGEVGE